MIKIGIIEDDLVYLTLLKNAIHFIPDHLVVIDAQSIEDFWVNLPNRAKLDLIFLDIELPGLSGIDALPQIRKYFMESEIIMLTRFEDVNNLVRAITLGANGYLLKGFPIHNLSKLLKEIREGGAAISPPMAKLLIKLFQPQTDLDHLSIKEKQILQLLSEGYSYEESAKIMGISINGIKYHVKNIYKKLNVNNKIEALRVFKQEP